MGLNLELDSDWAVSHIRYQVREIRFIDLEIKDLRDSSISGGSLYSDLRPQVH